ncbi:unnamed protein product, partial [Closterium sp. NIES-54]
TLSLAQWKAEYGSASTRTPSTLQTDISSAMLPLLAEDSEPDDADATYPPQPPPPVPAASPSATSSPSHSSLVFDLPAKRSLSAEALTAGEPSAEKPTPGEQSTEEPPTGEQLDDDSLSDVVGVGAADEGSKIWSSGEQSDDSDVVEVLVDKPEMRCSTHPRKAS